MTKYQEIIRLTGLGFLQRNITASCGVSQKTVVKVQVNLICHLTYPSNKLSTPAPYIPELTQYSTKNL